MTARTPITPYAIVRAGTGLDMSTVTPTASDVSNGNSVANSGRTFVDLHNTGATPRIMQFALSGGKDGQGFTPKSVTVAASATLRIGPFPQDIYGGTLNLNGAHAELTIAAFDLSAV